MRRPTTVSARQFARAMAAIGAVLDDDRRELMLSMTWRMVYYKQRRDPVLAAAQPFRPRSLEMPPRTGAQGRVRRTQKRA